MSWMAVNSPLCEVDRLVWQEGHRPSDSWAVACGEQGPREALVVSDV